jgi:hypothetical protein
MMMCQHGYGSFPVVWSAIPDAGEQRRDIFRVEVRAGFPELICRERAARQPGKPFLITLPLVPVSVLLIWVTFCQLSSRGPGLPQMPMERRSGDRTSELGL